MSCPAFTPILMKDTLDDSSDYGSDFTPDEEETLNELLAKAATEHAALHTTPPPPQQSTTDTTVKEAYFAVADIEDSYVAPSSSRTPRMLGPVWQVSRTGRAGPMANGGVAFVEHENSTEGRVRERERHVAREREWTVDADANTGADTRSPIERFRKPPNKAFSATDLISPAWCELQYWYTLTKFGRKRRTPAMKQGSTIHKTLEDEICTTVSVEITTKEDALALRIWNIIQGLRMLREFGVTRELEVWGLVDGELVNGVIDQLSYECPDPDLEATAASYYADVEASRAVLSEYQMSLSDYLLSPSQGGKRLSDISWHDEPQDSLDDSITGRQSSEAFNLPRIYMTDVKTRASDSVPTVKSSSFRPTLLQLQIYYHMLNRLATSDDVSIELLASRYNLDPTRTFTETFIAEVGGLNDQFFDTLSSQEFEYDFVSLQGEATKRQGSEFTDSTPSGSQDSTSILLAHNNLSSLWNLMKEQLRLTFLPPPHSSPVSVAPSIPSEFQPGLLEPYPTVLSPVLTARYLSSAPTTNHARVLGSRSFLFDPVTLTSYLSDQMEWWRGQRAPRGVEVTEAWKCRICEFRDECSWRQERELAFAKRRRRRSSLAV
ncbi:exonuclease V [Aspergillus alliaceus]|uniref:exonuclease V n=1 Tax=Petromyces alliaceus TaxID=209559 RepID=UPI0012A76730|nr:exonuclease V a 5' deoxyribonuclease-domain-containing protein [Aspergillus alliaceus]KAB8237338.1 exonuclease V a 5' deoxyribonuclease-domain-containing protein [Aspergillus alliaceus]